MKKNKNLIWCRIIIIFFSSFFSFSVSASALKGVTETGILVEKLNEEHEKCGITENLIDAAVRIPISNSRLRITTRLTSGFIYVHVNAISIGTSCVVSVKLTYAKFIASENEIGRFWFKQNLITWNKNNIGLRVANDLEGYTKQFIAEWLKANTN